VLVICPNTCSECAIALELEALHCVVVRAERLEDAPIDAFLGRAPDAVLALVESASRDADRLVRELRARPGMRSVPLIVGASCADAAPPQELAAIVAATARDARRR
jgi:hypothetical protein